MIFWKYLSCLVVLCFATPTFCAENIELSTDVVPSILYEGITKTIRIRCSFKGTFTNASIKYIKLRFRNTLDSKELAEVTGSSASITDPTLTTRASVAGQTFSDMGYAMYSYLDLTLRNTSCADVGHYICESYYMDANGRHQSLDDVENRGKSYPHDLEMRKEPQKTTYLVGDDVTFICSGKVGKPALSWTWQKYDDARNLWRVYRANVSTETPHNISDCAYSGVSRLTYHIPDEQEHKFRCIIGHNVDDSITMAIKGVFNILIG